ncbi:MAG: chemotaxis protein CheA [Anaerolineaceae bacterium]|nr:chemotaxis protein CheA [Anaerolineaceae bacterium]
MNQAFDISQDELPIFLAETEEHLQILEEGLVRLEQEEEDPELLQGLFRAAHTLKGMAGMIGHKRLVDVTHMMETAFDAVRKNQLNISTPLIDACLESIDALRLLRDEVDHGMVADVDIPSLVDLFAPFVETSAPAPRPAPPAPRPAPVQAAPAPQPDKPAPRPSRRTRSSSRSRAKTILIEADISPRSAASAARAFQIMLALQGLGQIVSMEPTQEQIESAAPVGHFSAIFSPTATPEQVLAELSQISELDTVRVGDQFVQLAEPAPAPAPTPVAPAASASSGPAPAEKDEAEEPPRLGEFLVSKGYIRPADLERALQIQKTKTNGSPPPRLGMIMVQAGILTQKELENAIAALLQQQRSAINTLQKGETERPRERLAEQTVRTSVERLDMLMNLVGELITDRNRLFQIRKYLENSYKTDDQVANLSETVVHVGRITDQLQEEIMHIRMVPISNVFNKYPRMVRDLAQKTGKEIELVIQGQDTELDRSVIEVINDPLIHLIRNSIDHGIENPAERTAAGKPSKGVLTLAARTEQGHIVVTVKDDGRGIDTQKLKRVALQKGLINETEAAAFNQDKAVDLIFFSGLSTSEKATDLSGRGVGMDIVRNNIERLNGTISVETHEGVGTSFQITLPLTLAIVPSLLVRVTDITFAIPLMMVTETLRLSEKDIYKVKGHPVTLLRNHVLSLMSLNKLYGLENGHGDSQHCYVVVVQSSKMQIGLVVDGLIGEEEVVVKSLDGLLGDVPGVSSAAILGDGKVALIVDIQGLLKLAGI